MNRRVGILVTLLAGAVLLAPSSGGAAISPSGVDWGNHRVLVLVSDDLGTSEYTYSVSAGTRYGLNVPWTAAQWENVAAAVRGHMDRWGVQVPLTEYVVASCLEIDFTPVTSDSSQVFEEHFTGSVPGWQTYGTYPPDLSTAHYVSPPTSALFDTPTIASDGWARRWVTECKEYELRFWFRLSRVDARTHLVSVSGPMGRTMGIEAQAGTGKLYLREGFWSDELLTPIAPYVLQVWRLVVIRAAGGWVKVDLGGDGSIELAKPAAMLPLLTNAVLLGDVSTTRYSGSAYVDDMIFTRFDNMYPLTPRRIPLDEKFPEVVKALNANRDVFQVQSHGLTHANDVEVQRRYANGLIDDRGLGEENWWREDYDAVHDRSWGVGYQAPRFVEIFGRLETLFGERPRIHVSPGNLYGRDTDVSLAMTGVHFHEAMSYGAGMVSTYEPEVFWSSRTGEQELFYRQPDPDPVLAAGLAARIVDSLLAAQVPAVLSTHAFNALVGTDGGPLATFYDRLLDSLAVVHPELVALSSYELAQLERDGQSTSRPVGDHIYARNYLTEAFWFHIPLDPAHVLSQVIRLNDGSTVAAQVMGGEIVFLAPPGDYDVCLAPAPPTRVVSETTAGEGSSRSGEGPRLRVVPNPANPAARIGVELPGPGPFRLEILDAGGRRIRELVGDASRAGSLEVAWDGTDEHGRPVASGVYFVRLQAATDFSQAKVLVVR